MRLSSQEEYGLRCLLRLARSEAGDPVNIQEIADGEGMTSEYVAKLMRTLRQGDFVVSTRGAGGGYRLSRRAGEITAWQVIQTIGGSLFPAEFCETHPGQLHDCVHSTGCSLRGLWSSVESAVRGVLQGVTLADLARDERGLLAIDPPPLEPASQVQR